MATQRGTDVLIKVGTKLLVGQRSISHSKSTTMIPTSSKTTGDHATFVGGRHTGTLAVSGIGSTAKEATAAGYWELYDAQEANVPVSVSWTEYTTEAGTTVTAGAEIVTQSALVSGLTGEFPDDADITFSCDFQLTGAPTRATNAGA